MHAHPNAIARLRAARRLLRTVCQVLIGALLFTQLAIAAYACPGLSPVPDPALQTSSVTGTAAQASSCADMAMPMDADYANLCAAHCHQGQQSDQATTLSLPAVCLAARYTTPLAPEPYLLPRPAADATGAMAAASPPLAILHCCFRI